MGIDGAEQYNMLNALVVVVSVPCYGFELDDAGQFWKYKLVRNFKSIALCSSVSPTRKLSAVRGRQLIVDEVAENTIEMHGVKMDSNDLIQS